MKNIGIYLFKTNETFTNKVYNLDNLPMRKIYQEYSKMTPFSVSNINRDVFVALNSPERNVICFVDALKLPLKVCNKIFTTIIVIFSIIVKNITIFFIHKFCIFIHFT